jgi:hypothetical protein
MKSDTTVNVKEPQKPVKYIINNISIRRGFVIYTDQSINHSVSMNNVDLEIPGFTWNSDSTNLGVDFRFVDGGRLYSKLALNQADSTYSVSLKLDSLNLDIIEPYVASSMHISALHGYLSNNVIIRGDMRSIMNLTVRGINRIFDFQLQDTLKRTVFSFDDLTVDVDTLLLAKNRIKVNSISLKKPFILFELIDSTNNWLAMMKPAAQVKSDTLPKKAETPAAQDESSFAFSKIEVEDGKVQISDKTLRYPFGYSIEKLLMTTVPDKTIPNWIDVKIAAELNGTGTFKASFALNPGSTSELDISWSIVQFSMKDMDSYFRHYFGFPVTGGRMNFDSQNKLRANSLVSNNSIYFRKFTLGKKNAEKTEYNIPLRLALGVMSDKDGIIDLKAPVEMKGENVKVGNIRKIILKTIGNLFVKAAVSPVNMISGLFKADPEALKEIHLQLTDPSPDKKNMQTVDILANVLTSKPGLNIDFVYCINPEKTSDTLAHMMALAEYLRSGNSAEAVPDSVLSKLLLGKMASDSLLAKSGLNDLCRQFIGTEVLNAKIDSLKRLQGSFLKAYMDNDKMIPADRYRIISVMPDSIKYDEAVPSFRTYFTAGEER